MLPLIDNELNRTLGFSAGICFRTAGSLGFVAATTLMPIGPLSLARYAMRRLPSCWMAMPSPMLPWPLSSVQLTSLRFLASSVGSAFEALLPGPGPWLQPSVPVSAIVPASPPIPRTNSRRVMCMARPPSELGPCYYWRLATVYSLLDDDFAHHAGLGVARNVAPELIRAGRGGRREAHGRGLLDGCVHLCDVERLAEERVRRVAFVRDLQRDLLAALYDQRIGLPLERVGTLDAGLAAGHGGHAVGRIWARRALANDGRAGHGGAGRCAGRFGRGGRCAGAWFGRAGGAAAAGRQRQAGGSQQRERGGFEHQAVFSRESGPNQGSHGRGASL